MVEAGSAVQAARELFIAPTAISMQIAQLEEHIGGPLLDRSRRPMELTMLGKYFYPRAKELLEHLHRLDEETHDIAIGKRGWLGVGFVRSTLFSTLPQTLRTFREAFPDVHIDLLEVITDEQPAYLRDGRIHIGLSRFLGEVERPADLIHNLMFYDPFVAALPIDHPLANRSTISVAELHGEPFIIYPKDHMSAFGQKMLSLLREAGEETIVSYEVIEIHTALALVAAGLGWTLVTRSISFNNRNDVAFIPISNVHAITRMVALTRAGEENALVNAFMSILVGHHENYYRPTHSPPL
ncbi:LysR family transcriptional regulator [Dickeya solani]|uniref:LysR family transcriptional regulator n=1 Tax=Dickeya solani TaxID=1089444 RepID=UPI0012FEDEAA|nr:LysR family transcriptional regulator [Dickeya solani]